MSCQLFQLPEGQFLGPNCSLCGDLLQEVAETNKAISMIADIAENAELKRPLFLSIHTCSGNYNQGHTTIAETISGRVLAMPLPLNELKNEFHPEEIKAVLPYLIDEDIDMARRYLKDLFRQQHRQRKKKEGVECSS